MREFIPNVPDQTNRSGLNIYQDNSRPKHPVGTVPIMKLLATRSVGYVCLKI